MHYFNCFKNVIKKYYSINNINFIKKGEIKFDPTKKSLGDAKRDHLNKGAAGVYILINRNNSKEFYIGSSVNLSSRFQDYIDLVESSSKPRSQTESYIARNTWDVVILQRCIKSITFAWEQKFIIELKPNINKTDMVLPRFDASWGDATEPFHFCFTEINHHSEGSRAHTLIFRIADYYKRISILNKNVNKNIAGDIRYIGNPVFVNKIRLL